MRLLKTFVYYFAGTLATRILQFLFLPLYTSRVSTADLGRYDTVFALVALATPLLFHGMRDGILRLGLDVPDQRGRERFFSTVVLTALAISAACLAVAIGLAAGFRNRYIALFALWTVLTGLMLVWATAARVLGANRAYATGNFALSATSMTLNFVFILGFHMGFDALVYATIFSYVAAIVVWECQFHLLRYVRPRHFDGTVFSEMRRFTRPLALANAAQECYNYSGKFLTAMLCGFSYSGLYAIASRFPIVLGIVTEVYGLAWQEEIIYRAGEKDVDAFFNETLDRMLCLCLCVLFVLMPLSAWVYPYVVKGDYGASLSYVPVLFWNAVLLSGATQLASTFMMAKTTRYFLIDMLSSTAVAALVIGVLSGLLGMELWGVVWGGAVAAVFRFALCTHLARKTIRVRLRIGKWLALTLLYAAVTVASFRLTGWALWGLAAVGGIFTLVFNRSLLFTLKDIWSARAGRLGREA